MNDTADPRCLIFQRSSNGPHSSSHCVSHLFLPQSQKPRDDAMTHISRRRWEFPWKVARSPHTFLSAHSVCHSTIWRWCVDTPKARVFAGRRKWSEFSISLRACFPWLHFPACEAMQVSLSSLRLTVERFSFFVFTHFEFIIANRHRGDPVIYIERRQNNLFSDLARVYLIQWPSYDFLAEINGKFIWANSTFAGGMHVV